MLTESEKRNELLSRAFPVNTKKPSYIALDIDGTLLSQNNQFDIEDMYRLVKFASISNLKIILATGRSIEETENLKEILDILDVQAIVTNCGMELYCRNVSKFEFETGYHNQLNSRVEEFDRDTIFSTLKQIGTIYPQEEEHQFPLKISFYTSDADLKYNQQLINEYRKEISGIDFLFTYNQAEKGFHYLDVQPHFATKLSGIAYYLNKNDSTLDDVIYFGDNGNDVPCFRKIALSAIIKTHLTNMHSYYSDVPWESIESVNSVGAGDILKTLERILA